MLQQSSRRATLGPSKCTQITSPTQIRHASLLRRPRRPYTFTQLVTLSDGSTFTQRTTSPTPIYRSTKDARNSALWNPSSQKLMNVEEDDAGRLKRFRGRFGRGWDAEPAVNSEDAGEGDEARDPSDQKDSLLDLIANFTNAPETDAKSAGTTEPAKKTAKPKGSDK